MKGADGVERSSVVRKAGPFVRREGVTGIEDEDPAVSEIEFGRLPGWITAGPPLGGRDNPNLPAKRPAGVVGRVWQPEPLRPPVILRELPRLTWPERCAESIRFAILGAEHWLSSGGLLREWIRLNLRVAVSLLAAAVLVVPPATFILESTAVWAFPLASAARNLSGTILGLPPVIVALSSLYLLARFLHRRVVRNRRYPRDPHDPYM